MKFFYVHFVFSGVDFAHPTLVVDSGSVLRMLTPNTPITFDASISISGGSSTVTGDNLFKITVFASNTYDGNGYRYVSIIVYIQYTKPNDQLPTDWSKVIFYHFFNHFL